MIRKHENSLALQAGVLALLVHALFFLLLVMSFDWRSEPPLRIEDVQLWDSLPAPKAEPLPPQEPPKPEPEPKVEPEPEPLPPPPEPKAEIVVKEKPKPKPEKKEEAPKPDPAIKKKEEEKKRQEALRKLQQEMLQDELAHDALNEEAQRLEAARNAEQARKAAAASSGVVDEFKGKIRQKIYSRMNRQPCGDAIAEYSISLMPTGDVAGTPKLVRSSGIPACDDAALRAIVQAQPLPLPPGSELFPNFRDLRIPFKPE